MFASIFPHAQPKNEVRRVKRIKLTICLETDLWLDSQKTCKPNVQLHLENKVNRNQILNTGLSDIRITLDLPQKQRINYNKNSHSRVFSSQTLCSSPSSRPEILCRTCLGGVDKFICHFRQNKKNLWGPGLVPEIVLGLEFSYFCKL